MSFLVSFALQRIRELGFRFFHRFGIHCATHQIRVLLISCVVITSLFYPALAIYSSSQPQFIAHYSSQILDSFNFADGLGYYPQTDVRNIWSGHNALRIRDDSVARARCGVERTLRVERILVYNGVPGETGALSSETLRSSLAFEKRISKLLSTRSRGLSCLSRRGTGCLVISPSLFWNHDETAILADPDIRNTLSLSSNTTVAGIPITPHMVLAGRELNEHASAKIEYASALALTYFFLETDCLGAASHAAWLQVIQDAAEGSADLIAEVQEPTLIALEHDRKSTKRRVSYVVSSFLYMAYFIFVVYFFRSMRRMTTVHSRIGLAFTGLIEMVVSTITSLSVCALVGFKVTMVPWSMILIAILFIGAENMFSLVDAVVQTSIALPVKQRIAEGLARAGTSNTLKVVSYNSILGVMAFFSVGAIRQFCAFAIVVLVAHWFLVHTFFTAVLSIDIQRLELDELLQQNTALGPGDPISPRDKTPPPRTTGQKFAVALLDMLYGRPARNISLFLLLAVTATLYYATYPSSPRVEREEIRLQSSYLPPRQKTTMDQESPASRVWYTLNPSDDPLVHLRIESPIIAVLRPEDDTNESADAKSYRPRLSMRTLRPLIWLLNIVVIPISATTALLYGLLLYLLKDAELLEAQRNRAGPETAEPRISWIESQVSFVTLPRAFSTDAELIASSKDGRVAASLGLENELVVWWTKDQSHVVMDTANSMLQMTDATSTSTAVTALSVDEEGRRLAAGTGSGTIAIWPIVKNASRSPPEFLQLTLPSAVTDLEFVTRPSRSSYDGPQRYILAIYDNGVAARWALDTFSTPTFVTATGASRAIKCTLLRFQSGETALLAFILADGTFELCDVMESALVPQPVFQAGNPTDIVARVHACYLELDGGKRLIIGATTRAGVVSLWDGKTGECISILEDTYGQISHLRISPVRQKTCALCGEHPPDSFSVSVSAGSLVVFYRVYASPQGRRCSCPRGDSQKLNARQTASSRRPRSTSQGAAGSTSAPASVRMRNPPVVDGSSVPSTSPFPVSSHGAHARRKSVEEAALRRMCEALGPSPDLDECQSSRTLGPPDKSATGPRTALWQGATVVRIGDASVERGGWDIVDERIVGLRRRSRPAENGAVRAHARASLTGRSLTGLSPATLERWELWTFDPSSLDFEASPLIRFPGRDRGDAAAATKSSSSSSRSRSSSRTSPNGSESQYDNDAIASSTSHPPLPFTRVSSVIGGRSFCLAGFGNTVGLFQFSFSSDPSHQQQLR